MPETQYIIYGSEYSPFSVKVRSYFRYKKIPHEWRPRTLERQAEFQKYAKLPLIPLVLGPGEEVFQDSTPIIEKFEKKFPEPALQPSSPELAYLSTLLEDYADEWVNKPMFHYRWWRPEDQQAVSDGLARALMPNGDKASTDKLAAQLRIRMVPRLRFVGSSELTKDIIEASLANLLKLLCAHLRGRAFLFGARPSLADFGLAGQIYCCLQQPTTEKMIRGQYPEITDWIDRMLDPQAIGGWEEWATLAPTLEPILKTEIGALYLPWSEANAKAVFAGAEEFSVELGGQRFSQQTAKYSAKALQTLKSKLSRTENRGVLEGILLKTGCLQPLVSQNW